VDQNLVEPPSPARLLPIRFTASGSEYFRIWIVNLLLMICTLGLYMPFAKARRLRYFHENTLVDGFPLAFHGDPWRMLRGYLLVGGVALVYAVLSRFWPLVGAGLLLVMAPAWPWLMRSALRFQLGQTSWRGLRMRFEGSIADAYRVFWPIALPLAITIVTQGMVKAAALAESGDPSQVADPSPIATGLMGLATLVLFGLYPLMHWRLKRYQHDHYALADEHTRLEGVRGWDFYKVQFGLFGVSLLCVLVIGGLIGLTMFVAPAALVVVGPALYLLMVAVAYAYMTGRLQDLVWSHTRSAHVRFHSRLSVSSLTWLTLKNSLLMVATLGLYWPFATVATTRMRLAAVSIEVSRPVEEFIGEARDASAEATGEAAGDLLGFDVAL
jgi:uncharacterized membrane protein YjgN (DUF898 family)